MMRKLILIGLTSSLLALGGCQSTTMINEAMTIYPDLIAEALPIRLPASFLPEAPEIDEDIPTDEWTLAKPNELGEIMVVMYHRLSEKEGVYDRSIEHFKGDLERLYNEGYRPVTMTSVVEGTVDLPAGLSPVVLTFDDGHSSNFRYLDDQVTIDPDCVVGIMLDFQKTHPDFSPHGIFYLTGPTPFGQRDLVEKKLRALVDMGFEVGNHTVSHENLKQLNATQISAEIGSMNQLLEKWSDHAVEHLSIPYGNRPKEAMAVEALNKSQSELYVYEMKTIVNVGWKPIASPFSTDFTPLSINRVICGEGDFSMHYWMDYFIKHPDRKYVSDGDRAYLSIQEKDLDKLKPDLQQDPRVRTYNAEDEK